MTTTNARTLRDEHPDESAEFDLSDLTVKETGQQKQQRQQKQAQDIHNTDDADLPKEFRGKSVSELVNMLQEKEKMIGRQANEIGHLRDLSDQLLNSQTHASSATAHSQSQEDSQPNAPEITSDDLFENPNEAISRAVSPLIESAVSEIKQSVGGLQATNAAQEFERRHPTYQEDMQDEEFQKFVQQSQYRTRLAAKAHNENDFEAADELWTAWEESKAESSEAKELDEDEGDREQHQQHDQRQKQLRDASTVRSGNGERGGGGSGNKPVYSARKLQEYRNRDPDGYYDPNFQAEILAAFRDGRVK